MGLNGKIITKVGINSDPYEFFKIFSEQPYLVPTISPNLVKNCELLEGEWGKVGSVLQWTYANDGNEKTAKERIEDIDEEKQLVKFNEIDGDLTLIYKPFVYNFTTVKNGEKSCLVTWTFEYEKLKNDEADPDWLHDFFITLTTDIEAYLARSQQLRGMEVSS